MINFEKQKIFYDDRWRQFHFANRLKLVRCISILEGILLTGIQEPRIIDLGYGSGWLAAIAGIFGSNNWSCSIRRGHKVGCTKIFVLC